MEMKRKTQIYLLILSLAMGLITVAVLKVSLNSGAEAPQMTQEQRLKALEKVAPQSPAMSRFLQNEQANRDATGDVLPP